LKPEKNPRVLRFFRFFIFPFFRFISFNSFEAKKRRAPFDHRAHAANLCGNLIPVFPFAPPPDDAHVFFSFGAFSLRRQLSRSIAAA